MSLTFLLEIIILKLENNCQIYDVTNRSSPSSQQSSQDVLRNSMNIFTKRKLIVFHKDLHTPY